MMSISKGELQTPAARPQQDREHEHRARERPAQEPPEERDRKKSCCEYE